MKVLGIDPGAGGAGAYLEGRDLVQVWDMPTVTTATGKRRIDAPALAAIVRKLPRIDQAIIELVGPMPRDGSAGSFWFGKSAGLAEGVLAGLGVPVITVPPQVWKRRLDVPANKDGARARATTLFGDIGEQFWPLKKHDGRAEAALIALWGYMDVVAGKW